MNASPDLPDAGAYAKVTYPKTGDEEEAKGQLIYLKPFIPTYVPADVLAYWAPHPSFPHETTADQFFTESQFESYRHLGEFIAGRSITAGKALSDWIAAASAAAEAANKSALEAKSAKKA
jgi:hypothetical protein